MALTLTDFDGLLAATTGHPIVRALSRRRRHGVRGWSARGATVWVAGHGDVHGHSGDQPDRVAVFGPPREAAELTGEVAHLLPEPCDISLPRESAGLLEGVVEFARRWDWDFRWTTERPPPTPGEDKVRVLGPECYPELGALLDRANPTASARPGAAGVRQWVGARDDSNRLVVVAADTSGPDIGHISSVATEPDARGRGFGAAVTAYLTTLHVAEFGVASLGFYADNEPARRLYDRLGYTGNVSMTSGPRA